MPEKYLIIPFFIPHIGCPYKCIFCSQKKITGRESPVTPEDILPTIHRYLKTLPQDRRKVEIAFYGGSFTGIPEDLQTSFLEAAVSAKSRGLVDGIRLSTRPDYIDKRILERLKKYRVDAIELGVQSMDNQVLKKSLRGHTAEDVLIASKLIQREGFVLGLQMMIGLPGSNLKKDIETARQICEIKPRMVRIYPALVIRGTALEALYKKGNYRPLSLEKAVDTCTVLAEMFMRESISIIRMGLQPTELINKGGEVVAGPFHAAFRQLVDSRLVKKAVNKAMDQRELGRVPAITVEVSPGTVSALQGIKKESIAALLEEYPGLSIKIVQNSALDKTAIRFFYESSMFEIDYREVLIKG